MLSLQFFMKFLRSSIHLVVILWKFIGIGTSCNPKRNPTGNKMILSVASFKLNSVV